MDEISGAVNTESTGGASIDTASSSFDGGTAQIAQDTSGNMGSGLAPELRGDAEQAAQDNEREQLIPRQRFDEVLSERDQIKREIEALQPYLPYLETLKQIGDPDVIQRQIETQSGALQAQERMRYQDHIKQQFTFLIDDGYATNEALAEIVPAIADVVYERDRLKQELQALRSEAQNGRVSEAINGLKAQFPNMDTEFVQAELAAGRDGRMVAERTHQRYQQAMMAARSQQATAQQQRDAGTIKLDTGSGGASVNRPLTQRDFRSMTPEQIAALPFEQIYEIMLRG